MALFSQDQTSNDFRRENTADYGEESYRGNTFQMELHEGWQDDTLYILSGPVTDGMQHNLTISIDHEPQLDTLPEYVEWQTASLEEQLKSCRLLLKEKIQLNNGMPAYRAIFSWYPSDEVRIYQEQIYVLTEEKAFTLTASFTKKTRKTLGPKVERMMRSFEPATRPTE